MNFFSLYFREAQKELKHIFGISLIYISDWIYTVINAYHLVALAVINIEGPLYF